MPVRSPSLVPSCPRGRMSPNQALIAAAVLAAVAASSVPAQLQFLDASAKQLPADNDATEALALGDVDGDGDLDLVLGNSRANRLAQNRLYLNDGRGRFTDATATRMPVDDDDTWAVALGDVDGDGDLDIVFGNRSGLLDNNRLYLNDGTGTFVDATRALMPPDNDSTFAVALGDVDGDGDPDLLFGNDSQNTLYLNDGRGQFTDVTATRMPPDTDFTRALALGDVDGDGDLDMASGNEGEQNRLYLNEGTGTFVDATAGRMPSDNDHSRGVALGDVDGDGDLDLVFGNGIFSQSTLYLNDGRGRFTDVTSTHMPPDNKDTMAMALGDVDGDADPDLIFANLSQSVLYLNDGRGRFTDVTERRMPPDGDWAEAVVLGDVDGDTDPDLIFGDVGYYTAQNRLYLNLLRQLDAPYPAQLRKHYLLAVYARYGRATNGDLAYPLLAPASANVPLPPLGTLFLDPSTMVALPPLAIPQPAGVSSVSLVVPNVPGLVGLPLYAQALLIQHPVAFLTNATQDVIQP